MKKTLIYSTMLAGALLSGSCSKDFLELAPESAVTGANFYQTKAQFTQAVNGAYNPLLAIYNGQMWRYGEMRSDNTTFQYQTNASGIENRNFDQFIEGRAYADGFFQNSYTGITRCNTIIDRLVTSTVPAADQVQIIGEASFLRAFYYYNLVRLYGSVPLVLKEATSIDEGYAVSKTKASVDDVYKQIIADATVAATNLPATYAAVDKGRATKYAAKMLIADAYITQGKYDLALAQLTGTDGVLGKYSLMSTYAANYGGTPASENNAESIFEVQYISSATIAGLNSSLHDQFTPYDMPSPYTPTGGIRPLDFNTSGYNVPTSDMLATYEAGDQRRAASINETYISPTTNKKVPYLIKYNGIHTVAGQYPNNFPVYRYAEALLFAAECYNKSTTQANDATARGFLNQVRVGLAANNTATGSALFDVMMHERRVELAFEDKRWFDLVRTGTAVAVMTAEGAKEKLEFPTTVPSTAYTDIRLLFVYPDRDTALIGI